MIDFAFLRSRVGLKRDLRCVCGSKCFSAAPLMVTNEDGRSVTSNVQASVNCSIYILTCFCGNRFLLSCDPAEQENTLIPVDSPEAKEFLEPSLPDFDKMGALEVPKETAR